MNERIEELRRLMNLYLEGEKWLDACPFRHAEYYYETANATFESIFEEAIEIARAEKLDEIVKRMEQHAEGVQEDPQEWWSATINMIPKGETA